METKVQKIGRELQGIWEGAAAGVVPGPIKYLVFPWLAGRQAGLKDYDAEKGSFKNHLFFHAKYFHKGTLENISLTKFFNHIGSELKGAGKSLAPLALMIPVNSMVAGPELEFSNGMAAVTLGVHMVGSYLISRNHAKNTLGPKYDQYRKTAQDTDNLKKALG